MSQEEIKLTAITQNLEHILITRKHAIDGGAVFDIKACAWEGEVGGGDQDTPPDGKRRQREIEREPESRSGF